jgi:holo-[acyl-carrier protein] synthase
VTVSKLRRSTGYDRVDGGIRVGVDLVRVADVVSSMERYGRRYTTRLFTEREIGETEGAAQAASLAARFAAKEATIKILEPILDIPGWREIEVRRHVGGRCSLVLRGVADQLAVAAGLDGWALSMSHEGSMAVAVVVATCRETAAAPLSIGGQERG